MVKVRLFTGLTLIVFTLFSLIGCSEKSVNDLDSTVKESNKEENAQLQTSNEEKSSGLQRSGGNTNESSLTTGGNVKETSLEHRAAELFSSLGAAESEIGTMVEIPDNVLFDFDSYELKSASKEVIDELIELANLLSEVPIHIIGHTDGRGSASYNLDLSQKRAEAVANELVEGGVDKERIKAKGAGSEQPLFEEGGEDDEEARARNRRVEVIFEGVDLED